MMWVMATRKADAPGDYARAVSKEVRSQLGILRISQATLARRTNLSENYLSKRLRDEFPFTLNDIERIAGALGLEFEALAIPPGHNSTNGAA